MCVSLDVIIVNWNSGPHLRRCLESLQRSSYEGFEVGRVVVVDNASFDGSAGELYYGKLRPVLFRNFKNLGFATACNQGAEGSRADYLLFLNPDVLLLPTSLSVPLQFMERSENARVGICGIQLLDSHGCVARSCARFPTLGIFMAQILGLERISRGLILELSDHLKSKPVDHVTGAFFLVRRRVFEELNGFDERFFVYFEDLDFSYRAYQAGWLSYYLASVQAKHAGGGSSGQVKAARLFYSLRVRIQYGFKHFGSVRGAVLLLATALIEPISRLALAAGHGSAKEARDTLQSYAKLWRELPSLILKDSRASMARGSVPSTAPSDIGKSGLGPKMLV